VARQVFRVLSPEDAPAEERPHDEDQDPDGPEEQKPVEVDVAEELGRAPRPHSIPTASM
jgi:hypothetical protein